MAYRPDEHATVNAHYESIGLFFVLMRLQKISGQHRCYEARTEQRKQHLNRDRYAELPEELAWNGRHEARRHEYRNNGQADGNDCKANLVGCLEGGLIRRLSHPDMTDNVLDFDDGVIDEDTGAERDREQAHHIEGEAYRVHDPECRKDRKR